jgi:DNA end-binding protein Ku
MARAIWSGAISFGLVTVPVKLYTAVSSKTVRFHQLHAKDGVRIQQKRWCPADEQEVAYEDIVKGYEIAPDRYVVIDQEELDALERSRSSTIDIEEFVDQSEIDPILYDHPYYLAPGTGGQKPYKLLVEAMREANKVAIARFVLRSKEKLVAIRASGDALLLETMIFVDEVLPADRLDEMPDESVETNDRERAIAEQLIESLAGPFEPEKYHDTYREEVLALIERKAAGEEISIQPAPEERPTEAADLMSALQASLEEVRKRTGDGAAAKPRRRRAATPSASNGGAKAGTGAKAASGAKAGNGASKRGSGGSAKASGGRRKTARKS